MNLNNQVELVMEYSTTTTRTRVNQLDWAPCASSTPVRKPLNSLSNFETVSDHRECDALPCRSNLKRTARKADETNNYHRNSNKKIRRNKVKGRGNFYRPDYEDDDDDDDEDDIWDHPDNGERKKGLIIKTGSNKFINKRLGWKGGNQSNVDSDAVISICKDEQIEKVVNKKEHDNKSIVNCKSNQNCLKSKIVAPFETSEITEHSKCPDNTIHPEIGEITVDNDITINSVTDNVLPQPTEFKETQSKDVVSHVDINYANRKIKFPLVKEAMVEKLKPKQRCQSVQKCEAIKNKNDTLVNVEITKNTERNGDTRTRKNPSSTSHEIFLDMKEKERQDSLDLNPCDIETSPDEVQLKSGAKHKKRKNFDSKFKLRLEIENCTNLDKEHPDKVKLTNTKNHCQNLEEHEVENPEIMEHNDTEEISQHCPNFSLEGKSEGSSNKYFKIDKSQLALNSCNNDFVKDILGMEYNENCSGDGKVAFSYALGWQFSSFKCCALKIDLKNEISGRTKHKNSHFGGVLLKGRLLMKINGTEINLKPGNMFCVPPLTDWKAVNISRTVCLLYYWCGRF